MFRQDIDLLLYLQVLANGSIREATWVTIGAVAIFTACAMVMCFTVCVPLHKTRDPFVEVGYCHPWTIWWALTYLHIITDFKIFVIPIPVVVAMTIPLRQNAGLLFVFTVSLLALPHLGAAHIWLNQLLHSPEATWDLVHIAN
ncbi:hypothetical protein VTK26DRAFT_653 [Humicola hyalothermophila]